MRYPATLFGTLLIAVLAAAPPGARAQGAYTNPGADSSDSRMSAGKTRQESASVRRVREAIEGAGTAAEGTAASAVKNLKVYEHRGKIVIKGTVNSKEEKEAVGAKASAAAGSQEVVNKLRVKMLK